MNDGKSGREYGEEYVEGLMVVLLRTGLYERESTRKRRNQVTAAASPACCGCRPYCKIFVLISQVRAFLVVCWGWAEEEEDQLLRCCNIYMYTVFWLKEGTLFRSCRVLLSYLLEYDIVPSKVDLSANEPLGSCPV